ncbi:hypothetical protein VST7929_00630 [Vibrio stylophorae]|uniref:Uncharacterized protein n=1 Tax=Vibrio stylophorae TaxID=659351 RepID=A0ABM8ZR53_9VIBR|nr:hypothetical protein [Vibrio stylophorae]CAH0532784.1 hypothetical protein VST7929_00630 [Vibrio stylophorae]
MLTKESYPESTVTVEDLIEAQQSGDKKKIAYAVCTYIAENTAAVIMKERQNGTDEAVALAAAQQIEGQEALAAVLVKRAYAIPKATTYKGKKQALDDFIFSVNYDCYMAAAK